MGLYTVLMVDDEEEVVEIISRTMNWEEMGFKVCGRGRNGVEALELTRQLQPDIIMTDIKMPYMDGLELARQAKREYPDVRIIVFSGFDDFEFAREAIALGAEEYLLKPVDSVQIRRVFERLKIKLDEEREKRNSTARLEEYYRNSLPLLKENFFMSLAEGSMPEENLQEYLRDYEIELKGPYFVVSVIHTGTSSLPENMSARLMKISVRQLAEEWMGNREGNNFFSYKGNVVVISQLGSPDEIAAYTDECDRFCRLAMHSCRAVVTVGIGRVVGNIHDISASYDGAREAVSYRVLYGCGLAINISEIDPREKFEDFGEEERLQRIFKQIKMGEEEGLKSSIDDYIEAINKAHIGLGGLRVLLMELVSSIYRFCGNNEIDLEKINPGGKDIYAGLLRMESTQELRKWLGSISFKMREVIRQERVNKTRSFVSRAREFVSDNFADSDLTVDMVCSKLAVSAAYFSTVFKKETGKTFIAYLTEYRMKEAVRLLIEQNEKTYVIARKVGYTDANYFSYVFKKQFGMSPTRYRNQGREGAAGTEGGASAKAGSGNSVLKGGKESG